MTQYIKHIIDLSGTHLHELADTYGISLKPIDAKGKRYYMGNCPLHDGISNTLFVYPKTGEWTCQECNRMNGRADERLDALAFVKTYSGCPDDEITALCALRDFAGKYEKEDTERRPRQKRVEFTDQYIFETRPFTIPELFLLGSPARAGLAEDGSRVPEWTTEQLNELFDLYALDSYTTPGHDGYSIQYTSSEDFPLFVFLYHTKEGEPYGYIYQPIRKNSDKQESSYRAFPDERAKEIRGMIFSDNGIKGYCLSVLKGDRSMLGAEEKKEEHLMLCSTPIDAINAYMRTRSIKTPRDPSESEECEIASGMERPINIGGSEDTEVVSGSERDRLHVCWVGTSTSRVSNDLVFTLNKVSRRIYICLHQDPKGIRMMNKIAYDNIYVQLVYLPEDMYSGSRGRLKSIQDYFMRYLTHRMTVSQKNWAFTLSIMTARSLKFWAPSLDKEGKPNGQYSIVNDNLMSFLEANGLYTYDDGDKTLSFARINGNRVTVIPPERIEKEAKEILLSYVYNSYQHYSKILVNSIHRSTQIKMKLLLTIKEAKLNFLYEAKHQNFFTFKNGTFRISKDDIRLAEPKEITFNIFEDKTIEHYFEPATSPMFTVSYSKEYQELLDQYNALEKRSEDWFEVKDQIDSFDELEKYVLNDDFNPDQFSFMKYVWNTGRIYWREEKQGVELTDRQKKEYVLHFVNKVWSIGYLLRKYKEESKPILIYLIENDIILYGKSEGRTGKSLLTKSLKALLQICDVDMRNVDLKQKGDTLFSGVRRNYTDLVNLEDFQRTQSIATFFNSVSGTMAARKLNQNVQLIPYIESPKFIVSSNFAPESMDGSIRGRVNFCAFSSYYHAANPSIRQREFSPRMEFGKDLVTDYTQEEMNQLFNFFFACIQVNMKFSEKIEPPMDNINKRTLIESIKQNVFDWMSDYFDEGAEEGCKLNMAIWRSDILEDYKSAFSKAYQDKISVQNLRQKLMKFCEYKRWVLNPTELYRNTSEMQREEYRKSRNGKDDYFWYIQTRPIDEATRIAFENKSIDPLETAINRSYSGSYTGSRQYKVNDRGNNEEAPF